MENSNERPSETLNSQRNLMEGDEENLANVIVLGDGLTVEVEIAAFACEPEVLRSVRENTANSSHRLDSNEEILARLKQIRRKKESGERWRRKNLVADQGDVESICRFEDSDGKVENDRIARS